MEVVPLCPFEAGALLWEPEAGQSSLTVLVKGTFALAPGELRVAPAQDPLAEERHLEDSALASLYWPGDFAPVKRRVDVTLVGHAYAPGGRPVEELTARLTVGDLVKAVRVTGDRLWSASLAPGAPQPFARMPLRYERAALSADNPVGLDRNAPPHPGQPSSPNLTRASGAGLPCFGPVSPQWRARRRVLDDAAMFWAYGVARDPRPGAPPLGPAPPRFDFAFFNAAPPDQQIDLLRAGAPLVLENLHPEHARLEARVPAMRPQVFRIPPPGSGKARVEEIIVRCDSLWIDTDRRVAVLTWRGLAEAPGGPGGVGTLVVDADPEGKKLRWERVEKRYAEVRPPTLRLPGNGLAGLGGGRPLGAAEEPDPLAVRYDGRQRPPEGPPAARAGGSDTVPPPPVAPSPVAPSLVAPSDPVRDEPTNPLDEPTIDRLPTPKPIAARPAKPLTITQLSPNPRAPAPRPPAPRPAPSPSRGGAHPPPALRKDLGIEAYAALSAELAQRGADRVQVLRARLLTEPVWAHVDQHWKKALAKGSEEGGGALQADFDDAYLAAQARLGRPVGVAEYARIQVAIERGGEIGRVLAELGLELGDLMRLQRAYTRRLAGDPALGAELARAVEELRRTLA